MTDGVGVPAEFSPRSKRNQAGRDSLHPWTAMTRLFSIILLLAMTASPALAEFTGRVVGVADGDTLSVLHDGKAERVRLNGIDCPEKGQPFGAQAKAVTSAMAFGREVTVRPVNLDKYGRTVADVVLPDGRNLNRELVALGLAWWYRKYSTDESLGHLEVAARVGKKGLWADPEPIPPWAFRKQQKAGPTVLSPTARP
jgi:endonuclease YncB( thermonuclease family)